MAPSGLIAIFASLLLLSALPSISQAQNADPICGDLTGAAFGQCTAAVAVGCDGSANQPAGCTRIAENFTRLTGTVPPWELGTCSCFTYDEIVADVDAHKAVGDSLFWCENSSSTAEGFGIYNGGSCTGRTVHPEFSAGVLKDALNEILGACSNHGVSLKLVTPGEPEACLATVKKAAADTNLPTL